MRTSTQAKCLQIAATFFLVLTSLARADEETVYIMDPFTVTTERMPSVVVTINPETGTADASLMNTGATTGVGGTSVGNPRSPGRPCFETRKISNFQSQDLKGITYEMDVPTNGTGRYVQVIQITKNYMNGEQSTAYFTEALRIANGKVFSATYGSQPQTGSFADMDHFRDVNATTLSSIDTSPANGSPIASVTMNIISSFIPGDSSAPAGFKRYDDNPNIVGNNGQVIDYGFDLYAKSGADLDLVFSGSQLTYRGFTVTIDSANPKAEFLNSNSCN